MSVHRKEPDYKPIQILLVNNGMPIQGIHASFETQNPPICSRYVIQLSWSAPQKKGDSQERNTLSKNHHHT